MEIRKKLGTEVMLRLRRSDEVLRTVMFCANSAKRCDVFRISRAKRTSLAKHTSRTKCAPRSAQAEHIIEKSQVEIRLGFFLVIPLQNKSIQGYRTKTVHDFCRQGTLIP